MPSQPWWLGVGGGGRESERLSPGPLDPEGVGGRSGRDGEEGAWRGRCSDLEALGGLSCTLTFDLLHLDPSAAEPRSHPGWKASGIYLLRVFILFPQI